MLPSLLMSWITITFCLSSCSILTNVLAQKPSATQTRETVVLHETFGALRFNLTWQNPIFTAQAYKASVSETAKITGQSIREKVVVTPAIHAYDDVNAGINAKYRYSIISGNEANFFEIDDQSGDLFLVREIDLEKLPSASLTLQIQATQVDNPLRQATTRVDIFVADMNDNRPEFEYDMYNITVMENLPPGFTVLQVYAIDADKGANAEFKYILDDPSGAFRIDENTGWISVMEPIKLDRETQDRIQMKVTAIELKQNVNPDITREPSTTTVTINLLDANDNNPQFFPSNLYTFSVLETAPSTTIVGSVFAHDNDLGENGDVVYYKQNDSISQHVPFDVHRNGTVYVLDAFTHHTKKPEHYTFFVVASDLARIHFERRTGVAVVRVNVTDINNSVPEFIGAPYEAYVGESLPEGAYITQIVARDADSSSAALEYSIIAGNDEKLFIIDSRHGKIFCSAVLDYEKKQSYDLLVQVSGGVNTAVAPLLVNVVDINDNAPVFAHKVYNFSVIEELNPNVTVGTVIAIDRDAGKNAQLSYNIVGEHANDAFYIDAGSGVIRTRRRLDRELESAIDFIVIAFDNGNPQLSGTTNVRVRIEDINDNPPVFEQESYTVEIPEEVSPPFNVFQLKAVDHDADDNAVTKYLILAGNDDNTFVLNAETGMLTTAERLNYEHKSEYVLHVAARNTRPFQGPHSENILNPAVQVIVNIRDINDEMVIFDQQAYRFKIYENTPSNTIVGVLNASNPRHESSEQDIVYWLDGGDGSTKSINGKFEINSKTGELVLRDYIDRDPPHNERIFKLRVYARVRNSINMFNTSVPVVIEVLDVNDNSPVFEENDTVVQLRENTAVGTVVTKLAATDLDELDKKGLKYHIVSGNEEEIFAIEESTGSIAVRVVPDREKSPAYMLRCVAIDTANNTGWTNLHIVILDENDWTPTFLNDTFVMNVTEGPTSVGTRIRLPVVDYDDGINRQMEVYILDGNANGEFRLDVDEGGPLLSIVSELDRERYNVTDAAVHFVTVVAKDKGNPPRMGRARIAIIIQDINDTPPKFEKESYYKFVSEEVAVGSIIAEIKATDADSSVNTNLVYSFARNTGKVPFAIDPTTGVVNVSRPLDISESEQWNFGVEVVDGLWKAVTTLKVFVSEAEERDPRFDQIHYRFAVPENKAGVLVGRVELKPRKLRVNALMRYNISNTEMRTLFNITPGFGILKGIRSIGQIWIQWYKLVVT